MRATACRTNCCWSRAGIVWVLLLVVGGMRHVAATSLTFAATVGEHIRCCAWAVREGRGRGVGRAVYGLLLKFVERVLSIECQASAEAAATEAAEQQAPLSMQPIGAHTQREREGGRKRARVAGQLLYYQSPSIPISLTNCSQSNHSLPVPVLLSLSLSPTHSLSQVLTILASNNRHICIIYYHHHSYQVPPTKLT